MPDYTMQLPIIQSDQPNVLEALRVGHTVRNMERQNYLAELAGRREERLAASAEAGQSLALAKGLSDIETERLNRAAKAATLVTQHLPALRDTPEDIAAFNNWLVQQGVPRHLLAKEGGYQDPAEFKDYVDRTMKLGLNLKEQAEAETARRNAATTPATVLEKVKQEGELSRAREQGGIEAKISPAGEQLTKREQANKLQEITTREQQQAKYRKPEKPEVTKHKALKGIADAQGKIAGFQATKERLTASGITPDVVAQFPVLAAMAHSKDPGAVREATRMIDEAIAGQQDIIAELSLYSGQTAAAAGAGAGATATGVSGKKQRVSVQGKTIGWLWDQVKKPGAKTPGEAVKHLKNTYEYSEAVAQDIIRRGIKAGKF